MHNWVRIPTAVVAAVLTMAAGRKAEAAPGNPVHRGLVASGVRPRVPILLEETFRGVWLRDEEGVLEATL